MSRFEKIDINELQGRDVAYLRGLYQEIEKFLNKTEMSSREKALAFTKLEESAMWANKAISLRRKQD